MELSLTTGKGKMVELNVKPNGRDEKRGNHVENDRGRGEGEGNAFWTIKKSGYQKTASNTVRVCGETFRR